MMNGKCKVKSKISLTQIKDLFSMLKHGFSFVSNYLSSKPHLKQKQFQYFSSNILIWNVKPFFSCGGSTNNE